MMKIQMMQEIKVSITMTKTPTSTMKSTTKKRMTLTFQMRLKKVVPSTRAAQIRSQKPQVTTISLREQPLRIR